ncbi:MAG: MFS transporter [Gammaproteobacteria bacterium SG8_15]|nr:MAG: MFS transporter [Gammaproteobacteria bacterium SG8_15]
MSSRTPIEQGLDWLYDQVTGEEDARVCKEIPDVACADQPRNFFAYLAANVLNKISDELVSARLTLPWLFSVLGVPAAFVGFLVPIREAGVLLPQLLVAAYVRAMPKRKIVWLIGALLSALMLLLMALTAWHTSGVLAGWLLLACLVFYSLARGLCSVSAKDVLGKTVSKTRRGRLMGYSASLAGLATLVIGLLLQGDFIGRNNLTVLIIFVVVASLLWLLAFASFSAITEPAGATEGGGNALTEALRSMRLLVDDKAFQRYVISRILLLSVALVIPFYVILVQQQLEGQLALLGWLIIANGLASSLSAPIVGKLADRSSRNVMAGAALLAAVVGVVTWYVSRFHADWSPGIGSVVTMFFLITLAHGAVRLGRKVYLVDMATSDNRAQYVAVSNTVIGIAMLLGGVVGVIADVFNVQTVILLLSLIAFAASLYIKTLPDVSG